MTCTETKASFNRPDIDFDKLKLPFFILDYHFIMR